MVSETLQLDAAGTWLFSYLLEAKPDGYSDGFCRACAPYAPGSSRHLSEPPSSASSPFPYPCRVIGMVMIAYVGGSHVRQIWDGRHLDRPGGHLGKPEVPRYGERHTGSFMLLLRFLRSCAWCGCARTLGADTRPSDSGDDLQGTSHTQISLLKVGSTWAKSPFMSS